MLVAFIAKDRPGQLETRMSVRPEHVEFLNKLNAEGTLAFAGPFLGEDGKPNGSLVVVEAESVDAAGKILAEDPYAKAGLFETTSLSAWNWVFNKPNAE
ncbi:MAG: hypothetical protein DI629_07940 [Mesorhizobium amorphae]|nr:MAG: hypothetical protein DI629_07940 [Mesorhizobium amorphae]